MKIFKIALGILLISIRLSAQVQTDVVSVKVT